MKNYEKQTQIYDKFMKKLNTNEILNTLEPIENEETFMLLAGCYLCNELENKIDFDDLCERIKKQANISTTVSEAESYLFVLTLAYVLACREERIEQRNKKMEKFNRLADEHYRKAAKLLARYDMVKEKFMANNL